MTTLLWQIGNSYSSNIFWILLHNLSWISSEIKLHSFENFALIWAFISSESDCLHFASRSRNSLKYRSSPGRDFSHIRLSPAYILRCKADWNVIENVITKPKDFVRETKKNCKSKGSWGFPLFKRVTLGTCFTLVCQWELHDNLLWWYAIQVLEEIRWHLILFIGAPAIGKCRFWPLKCSKFWWEFWQPFYGLIFKAEGCALKKWKAMKSNFCVLTVPPKIDTLSAGEQRACHNMSNIHTVWSLFCQILTVQCTTVLTNQKAKPQKRD